MTLGRKELSRGSCHVHRVKVIPVTLTTPVRSTGFRDIPRN